jgi:BMFP domain-containing protein YqiC
MKQNNTSKPVTTKILQKELGSLEKKVDIGLDNLQKELGSLEKRVDIKLENLKQDIDEKARGYRDDVLTKLDGVMGELQTIREENTVGTYQMSELRRRVDNHDKRIASLEKTQPSS